MKDDGSGIYTSFCALGQGTERGELRMGTQVMERSLLLCCLVALVIPANSLKCITCEGDKCSRKEVTCPGDSDKCATTALHIDSFPCKVRKVFKGCINSTTTTTKKISISPSEMTTISLQQEMCDSDLCNTQEVQDNGTAKNQNNLYCYSCISPGNICTREGMKELRCMGEQNMCVDMSITGPIGDIGDVNIKGCGQIPSCSQNLVFFNQQSSVSVRCCDENFCNSATDSVSEDHTPNGIQCYSCNTQDGAGCSPEEVVKAQCYGDLTSCLEVAGTSMKDGRPIPSLIKGCATPSMCDTSMVPMLQKLGTATVKCCNGNLCNNQFSESDLKASGYLPIGNSSPGTGNNTAGSGNNSSSGTSGSSSFGGYTNIPGSNESSTTYNSLANGTGMTNAWNNTNNSSSNNMVVPVGYANVPGANHSSTSYDSSGNGTVMPNEWINSNDSSHYMATPVGYNNIPGNNYSSTSNTGNGTGMSNDWSNINSFNPNTSVPVGYGNIPGNNDSTAYYTSYDNGITIPNKWSNSSFPNMSVPGEYVNITGNNDSTTYYTSSGSGTGMASDWSDSNNSNPNMSVPGGHANMPGSNNYSTSYASSVNGTGMTNEWLNNSSYHNTPGGDYGSFNSNGSNYFSNNNYSSNSVMQNNGSTYGNGSKFGNSSGSIGSYLNHMSSGENENGSYSNTSFGPNDLIQGGSSYDNDTAWIYSSNIDPNMMPNNSNNGSFSNYNDILNFLSKMNGSNAGNGSKNVNEWIQNNSFFSQLMPPGMNHNDSGPSGYNINSIYNGSLIDYLNSMANSRNNSHIHNINSISSGDNNEPFNISNFISGWNNIIHNPNLMHPYAHHNGSTYSSETIPSNSGSSYSNIHNTNVISSGSPNSNGSTNTNGYFEEAGFNGQPNNTYGMSSGGHNQLSPDGNKTADFFNNGSNTGHESMNSSNYTSNIHGVGSGGSSHGGASTDSNSSGYNTNLMDNGLNGSMLGNGSNTDGLGSNNHIPDLLVPDRSTNDSTSGGTGNSMDNSASSLWTKSGSLLIFSAIGLLVLN